MRYLAVLLLCGCTKLAVVGSGNSVEFCPAVETLNEEQNHAMRKGEKVQAGEGPEAESCGGKKKPEPE